MIKTSQLNFSYHLFSASCKHCHLLGQCFDTPVCCLVSQVLTFTVLKICDQDLTNWSHLLEFLTRGRLCALPLHFLLRVLGYNPCYTCRHRPAYHFCLVNLKHPQKFFWTVEMNSLLATCSTFEVPILSTHFFIPKSLLKVICTDVHNLSYEPAC